MNNDWESYDSYKQMKEGAQRNFDAYYGKLEILLMWERKGVRNEYTKALQKRIDCKKCQLKNRGAL